MRIYRSRLGVVAVSMLAFAGAAVAEDAAPADAAPAKPAVPVLSDILDASGITLTGYVDGSFAYQHNDTTKQDYNTFALQQASFTLAKQPTSGFGAVVQESLRGRAPMRRPVLAASLRDWAPPPPTSTCCKPLRNM